MSSCMNVSANSRAYGGRETSTTDTNYWIGSTGWGTTGFDTLWNYGSCFFDTWSNPSGQPSGTSHWTGLQAMHYNAGSQTNSYGMRIVTGAGNPALTYIQGQWGATSYGWQKLWNAGNDGSGSGLDADTLDGLHGSSYLRTDTADTASGDITFSGGAAAVNIAANSDIRLASGTWTGEHSCKIQHHSNYLYIQGGSNGTLLRASNGHNTVHVTSTSVTIAAGSDIRFTTGTWTGNAYGKIQLHNDHLYIAGGSSGDYSWIFRYSNNDRIYIKSDGTIWPTSHDSSDLGTSGNRWRNVYTTDLQLSNKGKEGGNEVDGTWGDWTLQEGEDKIFMINNRTGKKYSLIMKEEN